MYNDKKDIFQEENRNRNKNNYNNSNKKWAKITFQRQRVMLAWQSQT